MTPSLTDALLAAGTTAIAYETDKYGPPRAYVLEHLELAARIERTRPLTFRERRARQILIDLLHRHG